MLMRFKQGKKRNRRIGEPFGVRAKRFVSRAFKVTLVVTVLPSAAYGAYRLYNGIITTPRLGVNMINVTGAARLSREEVIGLSKIQEGQNIFSFKAADVASAIKENPWIEEAKVKRSLPDTVEIEVREREPVALIRLDELYVMDSSGVVFKKASVDDSLDLPVVTGLTAEMLKEDARSLEDRLLALIDVLAEREGFDLAQVSEINVDPVFGLSIYTVEDGVRLEVGLDGFEEKLASFERILKLRGGELRGIEAMDFSNAREVVVRFSTNVVKEGGEADGKKG